jgi:hypothetical protein
MIVDELTEDGVPIPSGPSDDVKVFDDTRVAVNV